MNVSVSMVEALHQFDLTLPQLKRLRIKDVSGVLSHFLSSSPAFDGEENKSGHDTASESNSGISDGSAPNSRALVWDELANSGELVNEGQVGTVDESARICGGTAVAGANLAGPRKGVQGFHLFRSKQVRVSYVKSINVYNIGVSHASHN